MRTTVKNTLTSVLAICFLILFSAGVHGQDGDGDSTPNILVELAFMKSKNSSYLDVEQKMWKAIHQERINQGKLTAWYLMAVRYPQGTETMYDYITVNVYDNPKDQLKNPMDGLSDMIKKVHPDVDQDEFWTKTIESRDMKWVGLWAFLDEAVPGPSDPSDFIRINFFTVEEGMYQDYVQMEREIFKPLHKAAAEAGARKDWTLWQKISPTGTAHGTTHITVDSYGTWEEWNSDGVDLNELFKKVHPDKNQDEVWEKMAKLRSTTRSETWQLVDYVNSKTE